jgi:TolB-like protein
MPPLANEGSDPNTEHLSEGLPESITRGLSRLEGFQVNVIAQSAVARMKGPSPNVRTLDAQEAGRLLDGPSCGRSRSSHAAQVAMAGPPNVM